MGRTLRSDIKQVKPFKSLEEEVLLTIVRTAADLEHQLEQELKPFGITSTQYNVLRILRGAGTDGLCRNEVGTRLVRPVPDVTRLLDRMDEAGLIARERGGMDRRYVTTRLTTKGLDLVNTLDRDIVKIHQEQLGHMGRARMKALLGLLAEVRNPS